MIILKTFSIYFYINTLVSETSFQHLHREDEKKSSLDKCFSYFSTIRLLFNSVSFLIFNVQRILVLSDGEILEFGTPADLLSNKQGMFYSMAKESNLVQ